MGPVDKIWDCLLWFFRDQRHAGPESPGRLSSCSYAGGTTGPQCVRLLTNPDCVPFPRRRTLGLVAAKLWQKGGRAILNQASLPLPLHLCARRSETGERLFSAVVLL